MPFLALIPRGVWIGLVVAILAVGAYWKITSDAEQRGAAATIIKTQQEQADAQDRAEIERRRLDRGDDSGVRKFDRD